MVYQYMTFSWAALSISGLTLLQQPPWPPLVLSPWFLGSSCWSLGLGPWSLGLGTWLLVLGLWFRVLRPWFLVLRPLFSVLVVVSWTSWFLVLGSWSLVLCPRSLVWVGPWILVVEDRVPKDIMSSGIKSSATEGVGPWFLVLGHWSSVLGPWFLGHK